MYAGKTEAVIRIARRYKAINKRILFINHVIDNRYSKDDYVVSHNGTREKCIKLNKLNELKDEIKQVDVVIIEEAQFFSDLLEFFNTKNLNDKIFIVSGLSGDYNQNPIGDILSLIPKAEYIEKLNGFCKYCNDGTLGCFTKKSISSDSDSIIQVGGFELYDCVCRLHL